MNFKTLTAIGAAAAVAGFLAAPQAKADTDIWFWDGFGQTEASGTYSHNTQNAAGTTGWTDVIGNLNQFDSAGILVTLLSDGSGDVEVTTYTNYHWGEFGNGSSAVPLADWFFQTGNGLYAVTPTSTEAAPGTISGTLKSNVTTQGTTAAMAVLGYGSGFARNTAVCDGTNGNCSPLAQGEPQVRTLSGTTDTNPLNVNFAIGGYNNGGSWFGTNPYQAVAANYQHAYNFTLAGVNSGGAWDNVQVFWGTGWCGNDTVGTMVPIPAAAWLFGSAILGLGAVGWKRRSPAA